MTTRQPCGTFERTHACGWSGTYATEAVADYALRQHSCEKWTGKLAAQARRATMMAEIDRTPKPCLHPVADHQHGTYAAYVLDGCRCEPCTAARSAYDNQRFKNIAYGRSHWTDPEPARQHVRALMNQGMGLNRIITLGGSNGGQLWKLLYGALREDGTRVPTKRIRKDVAARILAVELDLAGGARVRSLGSTRRLRALVALGWSQAELARRLGVTDTAVSRIISGRYETVVANATAITRLYDELSMVKPPEMTQHQRADAAKSRARARRMGWQPPLAIDDETLDDDFEGGEIPHELDGPDVDDIAIERRMAGDQSVHLNNAEKAELRRRWYASGRTGADLERICGMAPATRTIDREAS
jgi:transcriptional regulator with XRE-family HTH domain